MTPKGHVQGVLGTLDAPSLGRTLIHEHLFVSLRCYWEPQEDPAVAFESVSLASLADVRANPFSCRDNLEIDEPEVVRKELQSFADAQGRTIVEVSSCGMQRDPRALAWASQATGVNIIAGCGYYLRSSHPADFHLRSATSLSEEMIRELTEGIDDTGIRAGVIGELGVSSFPMDGVERRVLTAAALAQAATDAAMIVHSAPDARSPFEIVDVLEQAGADLHKVVISHLDERFRDDIELYRRLGRSGARLGLDTFGREVYLKSRLRQHPTDEARIDIVCRLMDSGLEASVLLSQDICLKHELSVFGGHGYSHILQRILPRLQERGVSDDTVATLLIDNPARLLTGSGGTDG